MADSRSVSLQAEARYRRISLLVLAAGALLLLLASSMTWAVATTTIAGASVPLDGATCLPGARAVALLALAAIGGLLAARGVLRLLIGLLVTAVSLLVMAACVSALRNGFADVAAAALPVSVDGSAAVVMNRSVLPPLLALMGLLLVAVGGLVAVLTSRRWPTLGSRYERPTPAGTAVAESADQSRSGADLWNALDRGEDPTT
jgi:hypothetical protein